jgi:S1-C subfamily serine protease
MKKDPVYYKLQYKTNIFLKDKGSIRVYEIISENKKINGIEIYQLEKNDKYFLSNSIYKTLYYDSVKELLISNESTLPESDEQDSYSSKFLKLYESTNQFLSKYNYKRIFVLIVIISLIYTGIESSGITKKINIFNSEIQPQSPDKIFEKHKGSVVLIMSEFYYEIRSNNNLLYYSPSSKEKIFSSLDEVLSNLSSSTGTGFIISSEGEILTNNHVVNKKDESFKDEIQKQKELSENNLTELINSINDRIEKIKNYFDINNGQISQYEYEDLNKDYKELLNTKKQLILQYEVIHNIDINSFVSKLVIKNLGIAYNDTHVNDFNDLQECVVIKTSDDPKVDLALIQTKNKSFNIIPNNIFNLIDNNPNLKNNSNFIERDIKNPVKINDDVYMIGYNRGFDLAITKQGIKSQFTSGKISQENDGERILYTIPTLEGSSGSPIVDKWGNLVGVNFAKITNSQNFSFGVPVNKVKEFLDK